MWQKDLTDGIKLANELALKQRDSLGGPHLITGGFVYLLKTFF